MPPGINRTRRPFLSAGAGEGLANRVVGRRRVPFPPPEQGKLRHLLQRRTRAGRDAAGTLTPAAAASSQAHSNLLLNKLL